MVGLSWIRWGILRGELWGKEGEGKGVKMKSGENEGLS